MSPIQRDGLQWSPIFRTLWDQKGCPDYQNVLISGVEDVLWQSMENHLVPLACVHNREVSAVKGAGLEGFHCTHILVSWCSTWTNNGWITAQCTYMLCMLINTLVSWCGGKLWVDQRKKCADICDVAQVTDIPTLPN